MNAQPHLTDEILLHALYGVCESDAGLHLRSCADCARRLGVFEQKRAASAVAAADGVVSDDFLATQRRAIYQRLERSERKHTLWAPALAAACALAVGVFVYRPAAPVAPPTQVTAVNEMSDAQLFNDLYTIDQSQEPAAAVPIRSLFEEPE